MCRRLEQVATLALHSIYSGQSSFDLWRQGLSDDVSIEAAEVLADGAQKLLVRHHRNSSPALHAASHSRLQITALVEIGTG